MNRLAGALVVTGSLALSGVRGGAPSPAPPASILLVTIDTLRADHVGCYGSGSAETPNLDRLAREGVRFEEARSHVPLTLPSHATILTGLLPPHHAIRANGASRLAPGATTLAAVLRARGYRTAAVVSSVVLDRVAGLDRGFDTYDDNQRVGERAAFDYAERGASQVADAVAREMARLDPPFFLWVHLYDPHRPWVPPDPYRTKHAGSLYDGEIAFADAALGEIWKRAADRAGGKLIVAALSDHGESLGEHGENQHGYTLHRGVLRVPFLLAGPGVPRGQVVRETVGLVDVAPTLADLAGAKLAGADGRSLRATWGTTRKSGGDGVLWEETLHPLYDSGWAPLRGLLTPRWHFVDAPRPELYDRRKDPEDRADLAAKDAAKVEELRRELRELRAQLQDADEPGLVQDPSPEEEERLERLASLGYLARSPGPAKSARLDPKDGLPGFLALESAQELIALGKGEDARKLLEPALKKDPANPRLLHGIAQALALEGNLERAEELLARAVALDPRSGFIRTTHASVLEERGDLAGAERELRTVLSTNPRDVDASIALAALASRKKDPAGALAILRASYDAGARDGDLLDALGRQLLRESKKVEAAKLFQEALALRPDDPVALYELGQDALRREDARRAIELLARCTDGRLAFECRIELARAYVVGPRDLAAARRQLGAARDVAPDDGARREVDRRLAALDSMLP